MSFNLKVDLGLAIISESSLGIAVMSIPHDIEKSITVYIETVFVIAVNDQVET